MTTLQPLTDVQVQSRLDAYNPGGTLEREWHAEGLRVRIALPRKALSR